ncbi:Fic family protein [Roseovarius sp. LXJ103]|uniref:Fic family protein n=1 Tax=Roseovarius carneus TaxID=2853164 RepID=UPI000D61C45A|nr:Fic family protein [Roseovarius carneus]MBZ8117376.1 Fic family protein [Roseovarius carneus]PWE36806.1 addiction module protein [Pelagicola sp. LXJ1103]
MLTSSYNLPPLPPSVDLETVPVLKALAAANRALAELKGRAASIPNQGILIDTLALQEAKASSEIENIVTTQDELFQADLFPEGPQSGAAKEVALYRDAIKLGFERLHATDGLITNATIIDMFQLLKGRSDGFRCTPGTALKNEATNGIVYVPPQDRREVVDQMTALERFVNDDEISDLDPLIKMAIIHHQFESIHPFPDGNGRVGRILNVLYLTKSGLLDIPILYLSRYITSNKGDYYHHLQAVRDEDAWEEWILYMLNAVTETSKETLFLIEAIRGQMSDYKQRLRNELPKIYSQDLLNNLFRHPYTRIEFMVTDLGITRQTASKYLETLAAHGFVEKHQAGRSNYYINVPLVSLFMDGNK